MRTTLDIDDRVLAAARALAAAEKISVGRALSDLALASLTAPGPGAGDFPSFEAPPGHVISDELVAEHRDD